MIFQTDLAGSGSVVCQREKPCSKSSFRMIGLESLAKAPRPAKINVQTTSGRKRLNMVSVAPRWLFGKLLGPAADRCDRHSHHHTGRPTASPTVWNLLLLRRFDRAYYFSRPSTGRSTIFFGG